MGLYIYFQIVQPFNKFDTHVDILKENVKINVIYPIGKNRVLENSANVFWVSMILKYTNFPKDRF